MKISIIIPIYKVEAYIEKCLLSVMRQDYEKIELILVDDASPDDSIEIAKRTIADCGFCGEFKLVTHTGNKGLSVARNSGIEVATGDYLFFLDSDDELFDKHSITLLVRNAKATGADIVVGNYMGVKPDSSYVSKYRDTRVLCGDSLISAFVKGDVPITAWNKLINRRMFDAGLMFKEGILNEDELFAYQTIFMNPTVSMSGTTTYRYNIRGGSIMTTLNYNRLISPIIVHEEVVSFYKGDNAELLRNIDHFAFKRHVDIIMSDADAKIKRELYQRLRKSQRKIKGVGKMRYIYNFHIFLPLEIGFRVMEIIANKYAKSRNL